MFDFVFDVFKGSKDPVVWGACVYVFRWFSHDLAVPALLYALDNRLHCMSIVGVVRSLAAIRDNRVVEPLTHALYDENI